MTRKDNEITNDQESISYVLITQGEIPTQRKHLDVSGHDHVHSVAQGVGVSHGSAFPKECLWG